MGWIGRSLGNLGSQVGEGYGIAQDWRTREQELQLAKVKQQIESLKAPLEIQEIQQRLAAAMRPKPVGTIGTPGGGTAGLTFNPNTSEYGTQQIQAGADPARVTSTIEGMKTKVPKEFQAAIQGHIDAIAAGADPMKELAGAQKDLDTAAIKATPSGTTINRLQQRAADQLAGGDMAGYKDTLKEISDLQKANKQSTPTMWGTIAAAQQGDPDAIVRLKMYQKMQSDLVKERGLAFGQGRLFALQSAWIDGEPTVMTGFEVLQAKREGKDVTIGGPLPAATRIAYQQLYAEAGPALKGVEASLKAFDNATDRAVFARAVTAAGQPERGDEGQWFHNVISQLAKDQLSPEGRALSVSLGRLGETMGRFRGVAGLQATDSAMAITMGLLPGPTTPDAAYAKMQIDALRQMITQAGGIPAMRNQGQGTLDNPTPTAPGAGAGRTPPPGSKIQEWSDFK